MSKLIRAEDVIEKLKKAYPIDRVALANLTRIVEECEEVKIEAKENEPAKTSKPRRKTNAN